MKRLAWMLLAVVLVSTAAEAQTLGTFRWQLQPYCNVLTVTVVQQGAQYQVDGTDDQCGAAQQASVVGRAFPNPDGLIGFGLTTVTTTNATAIHIDARLNVATLGGTWRDSAGNSGTFAFRTGAGTGGNPRPIPAGGIAPGTITGAQIAAGTITATQLSSTAVAGSLGSCPAGQYLRGFLNGAAVCDLIATVPVSTTVDSSSGTGDFGWGTSIAIGADGVPIIAHRDFNNVGVRLTHCGNPACTSAASVSSGSSGVNSQTAIAIGTDGRALVAYAENSSGDLGISHCSDILCSSTTSATFATGGTDGHLASLAIGRDGRGIVVHYDLTNQRLRVMHCTDIPCASGTTATPLATFASSPSIAIAANGLPAFSYQTTTEVRLAFCADAVCTSVSTVPLAAAPGGPNATRLAIDGAGRPVVAWTDDDGNTGLTLCADPACGTAVTRILTEFSSLAVAIGGDGLPVVAGRDPSQGNALVIHCNDAACATSTTATVDAIGDVGEYIAVAIGADTLPVMSYRDTTNRDLRVTKCLSRTCQ